MCQIPSTVCPLADAKSNIHREISKYPFILFFYSYYINSQPLMASIGSSRLRFISNILSEVMLQYRAPRRLPEPADTFLLYLSYAFAGKSERLPYLFKGHGGSAVETVVKGYNIGFPLAQRG